MTDPDKNVDNKFNSLFNEINTKLVWLVLLSTIYSDQFAVTPDHITILTMIIIAYILFCIIYIESDYCIGFYTYFAEDHLERYGKEEIGRNL